MSSPSSSLSYPPISAVLMARGYTMRQNSFFRTSEWDWLKKAVLKPDIQEWIAKQNYSNAHTVLVEGFQKKFTTSAEGESKEVYKKCHCGMKKNRKDQIVCIHTESEEEFEWRMAVLPDICM